MWAEIKTPKKYIYLIEMELRPEERGRSSLTITSKINTEKPVELTTQDFEDILKLTAVHNGWPPSGKDWKAKYAETAKRLFDAFFFERLTHAYAVAKKPAPANPEAPTNEPADTKTANEQVAVNPKDWAQDTLEKIVELFG